MPLSLVPGDVKGAKWVLLCTWGLCLTLGDVRMKQQKKKDSEGEAYSLTRVRKRLVFWLLFHEREASKCFPVLHLQKNVIASKNLLYSTGTSSQYSVMTNTGKESKKSGYLYN